MYCIKESLVACLHYKEQRGPTCKKTECFTRGKETRRVDVPKYKDLDSFWGDLSPFPSIIVLCLQNLITSSITGTEQNNTQAQITLWTALTFPHPTAVFHQVTQVKKSLKTKMQITPYRTTTHILVLNKLSPSWCFFCSVALLISQTSILQWLWKTAVQKKIDFL